MDSKRAANLANIGTFILTLVIAVLTVALLVFAVWVRWYPDPAKAPTPQVEALMSGYGWGPPIFLGGCLLLTVILQMALRRKKGKPTPTSVTAQTEVEQALIKSNAKLASLEQKFGVLQARDDEFKWLREIADTQRKAIPDYVVTDCWIIEHDLLRESPFIDFQVSYRSACVYQLSAVRIRGSVRFANQRLSCDAVMSQNLVNNLDVGEVGWTTITQPLTRDDAIRILNQNNSFYFDQVTIELEASPGIAESIIVRPRGSIESRVLRDRYPNLIIRIKRPLYSGIVDRQDSAKLSEMNSVIRMEVEIENPRKHKIEIDTIQLSTLTTGPRVVSVAEAGEIYENKYIDASGAAQPLGKRLKNLAVLPLVIIGHGRVSGCLEFTLDGAGPDALRDTASSLTLTDKFGEQHTESCTPVFKLDA